MIHLPHMTFLHWLHINILKLSLVLTISIPHVHHSSGLFANIIENKTQAVEVEYSVIDYSESV